MEDYAVGVQANKEWYESKTIWGVIASAISVVVLAVGSFYGHDYEPLITVVATILGAFGIPFTWYGRTKAKGGIKKPFKRLQ
jgi:hypothetical protein